MSGFEVIEGEGERVPCGRKRNIVNKNRRKAIFNWAAKGLFFFRGEGAAIHSQATIKPCRRPLRETESHARLKHTHSEHCTLLKDFRNKKMSTIFK